MVDLPTAAAFFSVGVPTLRGFISRGKVRIHRLGTKLIRVRLSEVEADLERIRRVGRPKKARRRTYPIRGEDSSEPNLTEAKE